MIACVIPTIRPESYKKFLKAWKPLFEKHNVKLLTVWDGENPIVETTGGKWSVEMIMGKDADLIYNFNDGVRNLGFAYVAKFLPDVDTIITLDDDVEPTGDTIQDHLNALKMRVPISWVSTTETGFSRGFPYLVREEAEVVLSHGIWYGNVDWDAPTQLVNGNRTTWFEKKTIPKGIFYPMCGMNIAFKRKMLPYMYYAPMGNGVDRFADIWCGIESKRVIDKNGWAVITGYAFVNHKRASNVFKNLQKEAKGIEINEEFWKGKHPEVRRYRKLAKRWKEFIER